MTSAQPAEPRRYTGEDYLVETVPSPKRVRVVFNGHTVADSVNALLMREQGHVPVYYFPAGDVREDLLTPTNHRTHCPYKGDASYWTVQAGERSAENAVWSYEQPLPGVAGIHGHRAFYWKPMDAWYEEDEEIFVHPRDPFKRIDVLESHRPVRAELDGVVLAESTRARFLYETGLRTRYYFPRADVRTDLLEPSDTRTECPYKGRASYYSARIDGQVHTDLVWYYPEPLPEAGRVADYLCFYDERLDRLEVAPPPPLRR